MTHSNALQNPHFELDETNKSRAQRETLVHKLSALGIQFTRGLNMKVKGDDGKLVGEALSLPRRDLCSAHCRPLATHLASGHVDLPPQRSS